MKKQIIRDVTFMIIWWAILLAMSNTDIGDTLFDCFEAISEAVFPKCSSDMTDQVAAVSMIAMSTAIVSYFFNYVIRFFKKEFAKK